MNDYNGAGDMGNKKASREQSRNFVNTYMRKNNQGGPVYSDIMYKTP